jgi:hypothetical protein
LCNLLPKLFSSVSMKGNKSLSRESSTSWRAWRKTTIRVFVGLNLLIIVGFYVATSSFHGGLSHMDESSSHTSGTDAHRHGKLSSNSQTSLLLVTPLQVCCQYPTQSLQICVVLQSICLLSTMTVSFFNHICAQCQVTAVAW